MGLRFKMNNIEIDGFLAFFELEVIDLIFKRYSSLEDGSYEICSIKFPSGETQILFRYPTDFTHGDASYLLSEINLKISKLTIDQLLEELV